MKIQKLLFALCLFCTHAGFSQTIRYVKPGASGTGASWANAAGDIQAMINASAAGDQIWVAAGTYKPNRRVDAITVITPEHPFDAFLMKAGVKLYGGFAGTETALSARNWSANLSVLSGDISVGNNGNKCYHVVLNSGTAVSGTDTATLDGFTVRDGRANLNSFGTNVNGLTVIFNAGGGICNIGDLTSAAPIIANCLITKDTAIIDGGGIYNSYASPVIINCVISNNCGNGIYNDHASPAITNCIIAYNYTSNGGGIYNNGSSPIITHCIINGNTAIGQGGGIYNCCLSAPIITNCIIAADTAVIGAGIYNLNASPIITNCTIANNLATDNSGGIYNSIGSNLTFKLTNSIVWGNSSSIGNAGSAVTANYSIVQGGYTGTGNSSADPLFINAATGDYRLQTGSPAIDAGDNATYGLVGNINTDKDLANHPRLTGTTIDMGAYEACTITTGTDVVNACGSYTWINGITYTANNNTGTDTLVNATGCDSIVTLNLTINPLPNIAVTLNSGTATLTAAQTNASYQWIDCATNQAIAGATGQSYTNTNGGSFKVVVSLNGCSDTSNCMGVVPTGIKDIDWAKNISIFPNPANNIITISFPTLNATHLNIDIVDMEGRIVFQWGKEVSSAKHETTLDLTKVAKGIYFIRFNAGNGFGVKKLVIQ